MKKIALKTMAIAFTVAAGLSSCSSENTTGVETETTGAETEVEESQPNLGGKTGNSPELDSIATEEGNSTTGTEVETQQ